MSTSKPRIVWLQIEYCQERIPSDMTVILDYLLSELDADIIPSDEDKGYWLYYRD